MKVGVISDSHDNVKHMEKAVRIMKDEGVETIIHLGDAVSPFALIPLKEIEARKIYIFGNNDGEIYMHLKVGEKCGVEVLDPPVEVEVDKVMVQQVLPLVEVKEVEVVKEL